VFSIRSDTPTTRGVSHPHATVATTNDVTAAGNCVSPSRASATTDTNDVTVVTSFATTEGEFISPQRATATTATNYDTAAGKCPSPSRASATNDVTAAGKLCSPSCASVATDNNEATDPDNGNTPLSLSEGDAAAGGSTTPVIWNNALAIMRHIVDESLQGKAPCNDDVVVLPTFSQKRPHPSAIPPISATFHSAHNLAEKCQYGKKPREIKTSGYGCIAANMTLQTSTTAFTMDLRQSQLTSEAL
jgi:hypothetical protein